MSHPRFKNAYLRLDNAAEHIAKVNKILREQRPFAYILETNTKTRQRATFAKKNEAVIDAIGVASSDAFSNIRAALDYGYWQVVSPFVPDEKRQKGIQFPSCKEASRLEEAIKNRFAHFVSTEFFDEIVALKPHGEPGGNKLLYVLEKAATPDRHRDLTPVADYKAVTSDIIRRQAPDFPLGFNIAAGGCERDIVWGAGRIDVRKIGTLIPGSFNVFEKELAVPVDILFIVTEANYRGPVVPTLNELLDLVKTILAMMERYA